MASDKQKLYVHVDESGQDDTSHFFIVVAVVTADELASIRERLLEVEDIARTYGLKWHKTNHTRRLRYLTLVLERKIGAGWVYVAHYKKPIPFFFAMVFVVGKAIKGGYVGGCMRGALLGDPDSTEIIRRAEQEGYFKET